MENNETNENHRNLCENHENYENHVKPFTTHKTNMKIKAIADKNMPLIAMAFKITDDTYGQLTYTRIYQGTLKKGDQIIAGTAFGRVRIMSDWHGTQVESAGPSTPIEIVGLETVPMSGDQVDFVEEEKAGREVVSRRQEALRNETQAKSKGATLEDLLAKVASQEAPEVPFIIKADTQGSAEAIAESMLKIKSEKQENH